MSPSELPSDQAPTSEWVAYGEHRAGSMFAEELEGYFTLARELVDAGGPLIARIAKHQGDTRAVHAGALILARILSDLAACAQLLRLGYAAQAFTLVGTMFELMHVLAYIGSNESRAADFAAWDNPTKAYPGPLSKTVKDNSRAFGADEKTAKREYDLIYRKICQIKHGNTLVLPIPNFAALGDYRCIVVGPLVSADFRRLAHEAIQLAIRYASLAEVQFIRHHVPEEESAAMIEVQTRISDKERELVQLSIRTLSDVSNGQQ